MTTTATPSSKPNILIVGSNGSGKSSSLENLLKKMGPSIDFIDTERKGLPFLLKGITLGSHKEVSNREALDAAVADAIKSPQKILVLDSFEKASQCFFQYCFLKYSGFDIYTSYANLIRKFLETLKSSGKVLITTDVDEIVNIETAEGSRVSRVRAFIKGKELEGKVEGEFLIVLHTIPKKATNGEIEFRFVTKTDGIISAKTPTWLELPTTMPNDVSVVVEKLQKMEQF